MEVLRPRLHGGCMKNYRKNDSLLCNFSDPLFIQNIRRFISTKADMLFKPVEVEEQEKLEEHFEDGKHNEWILCAS